MLQGAERFDHTRGYKFSTYVQYWIRKSMSMMVSRHARGVHIPVCAISFCFNRFFVCFVFSFVYLSLFLLADVNYPNYESDTKGA